MNDLSFTTKGGVSVLAAAREQTERELGPRPMNKSVGNWTGYATVSNAALAEEFRRVMDSMSAARAWDRRVSELCRQMGAAPATMGFER